MSNDWESRLAELQASKAKRLAEKGNVLLFNAPKPIDEVPPELAEAVPDASFTEDEEREVAEHIQSADQRIASQVEGIGVLQAYDMWIGKMKPRPTPGNPEVFVSCPSPTHADNNPSATANVETNLWVCHGCGAGGDVLDLAAIRYGMPEYKEGQNFHTLYRKIAEQDFGWVFENQGGFQVGLSPEDQAKKYDAAQRRLEEEKARLEQQEGQSNVFNISGDDEEEEEDDEDPRFGDPYRLEWRSLVNEGTFLDEYMKATVKDFIPEEFHFWNALMALGFAAGKSVKLEETYSNLFLCHLGPTSGGKSTSVSHMIKLLRQALPFDPAAPDHKGVYKFPNVSSGEFIIESLQGTYPPPAKGMPPIQPIDWEPGNIKGLAYYEEMTEFLKKSSRLGSTLKETAFKLYDCNDYVDTGSRTGGILIAKDPFVSFVTTNQPSRLRDQLTKDDVASGFLNRFIFTAGPKKPKPTRGRTAVNLDVASVQLQAIYHWIQEVHNGDLTLDWSEDGGMLWDEFCANVIFKMEDEGSESVKRISTAMIKLVMLFAINNHESEVSVDSVAKAFGLWDYLLKTYKIIDNQVNVSATTELEDKVLATIKKKLIGGKKPYVTVATLYQSLRNSCERWQIQRAMDVLVKMGELDEIEPPRKGKGRPPKGCYTLRSLLA